MPLLLKKNILLPFAAQDRMERLKYGPATFVPVTLGSTQVDVPADTTGFDTSILADNVPVVDLSWTTTQSIIPIPPNTDFRKGFRVLFGAAAPANATMSYHVFLRP